jgi:hypothetical protein
LLGALGSGVWQSLLGPAIHASSRWVLDIASLGMASYKNAVYQEIAADNSSRATVATLHLATMIYALLVLVGVQGLFIFLSSLRRKGKLLSERISGARRDSAPEGIAEIRAGLEGSIKSLDRLRWFMYAFTLFVAAALVNDYVSQAKFSYISSADGHFHQVLRVASPYLDTHEQAQVESEFAQVSSRDDYVKLLSRLESQCKAHGQTVPKFDPW